MKKILIANKQLEVANVCLGAMNFGTSTQKDEAFNILDKYLDFGGNLTDVDVMKLCGIAKNSYYKYKKEIRTEMEQE